MDIPIQGQHSLAINIYTNQIILNWLLTGVSLELSKWGRILNTALKYSAAHNVAESCSEIFKIISESDQ